MSPDDVRRLERLHETPGERRARLEKRRRKNRKRLRRQDRLAKVVIGIWLTLVVVWTALILTGAFLAVRWLWLETT